jgi:hypothetical protein
MRWPEGFVCPRCGCKEHCYLEKKRLYQCNHCAHQASVTAGTVMEHTRLPIKTWFWAIYLVANDKRGSSATYLGNVLNLRYKSAWLLLQKIRSAMGNRNANYLLEGIIEFDDTYFGGTKPGGKRGRGTLKTKVLVAVSKDKEGKPKYLRMQVVPNLRGKTIGAFAKAVIAETSTIETDALHSYRKPLSEKYNHNWEIFDVDKEMLVWLHTIVANAKSFVQGTFHGLDEIHLQRYLDEFCYRFDRRSRPSNIFFDLLRAVVFAPQVTYADLKG